MTDEQQDEQFYRDTESIAFPKLNDHQISLLEPLAERRVMKRGDILFKAGQRDLGLAIVLRGEIEAFETRDEPNITSLPRVSAISWATYRCSRARPSWVRRELHRTRPSSSSSRQPNFGARWRKFQPSARQSLTR